MHYQIHGGSNENQERTDEIKEFWDARYLSAGEAIWRILGFHIMQKEPTVTALPVYLPESTAHHQYHCRNNERSTLSLLDRYFLQPTGTFTDEDGTIRFFDDITYTEYFTLFHLSNTTTTRMANLFAERNTVIGSPSMHVIRRDHTHSHLTRIQPIHPSQGNLFYLRTILQNQSSLSFEDARTVDGFIKDTYQDTARAMGLFANRNEAQMAMEEAIQNLKTP